MHILCLKDRTEKLKKEIKEQKEFVGCYMRFLHSNDFINLFQAIYDGILNQAQTKGEIIKLPF